MEYIGPFQREILDSYWWGGLVKTNIHYLPQKTSKAKVCRTGTFLLDVIYPCTEVRKPRTVLQHVLPTRIPTWNVAARCS